MESVPKEGHTLFTPLTELIESLDADTYDWWNRAWMVSDRRSGPIHPLIYRHPQTDKPVNFIDLTPFLCLFILVSLYYNNLIMCRLCVFIWV